jgi:FlaA1/EpsC-like NDP-sugar epimerase
MKTQNYSNHKRYVIGFHVVLALLVLFVLIGSIVNLVISFQAAHDYFSASLIFVIAVMFSLIYGYSRTFALRAQDRAIRAEENLRHFALTGKLLNAKLTMEQIIALRFAPDEEFVNLAEKSVNENLSGDEIKKSIQNWKGDYYRV